MRHINTSLFTLSLILIFVFSSHAITIANDKDFLSLFTNNNIAGTIIISSLDGSKEFIHNRERSEKRFLPASTFKILHSLIALDEKAIENQHNVIGWDGKNTGWSRWNKDQSLASALPESCVWFFQKLAQRIGNNSYLTHLQKNTYGNLKTGPDVTTFWLNGDLAISAREQVDFLKRLYKKELPYSKEHMNTVANLLIVESAPDFIIKAKTGWAMRIENQHGWYVGYVEKKNETWFFATNIDIKSRHDAHFRKKITFQALKLKGIL